MRIQNWKLSEWDGAFDSNVPYAKNVTVSDKVAEYLNLTVEHVNTVHLRGNPEFTGADTVILNWGALGSPSRNPDYAIAKVEFQLKQWVGISWVIFIEGVLETDLTEAHIDGISRHTDLNSVVVPQFTESSICKLDDGRDDAVYSNAGSNYRSWEQSDQGFKRSDGGIRR